MKRVPLTEFLLAPVETDAGRIALVTIDNGEDYTKPTTFGRHALESLERLLPELEEGGWAGMLLTGKPFVFAAGADIDQFAGATAELAREGSRAGHELFGRIRALPYPTLAAINGACLGGGVEIALHCDLRTISTAVRHFACPEVFLGIFPAWGGTQLLPRLVGAGGGGHVRRREPAAPEPDARRPQGARARLRRRAARAGRVRRRVARVPRRAHRATGSDARRRRPIRTAWPRSCAGRASASTTRCTARRRRPTSRST